METNFQSSHAHFKPMRKTKMQKIYMWNNQNIAVHAGLHKPTEKIGLQVVLREYQFVYFYIIVTYIDVAPSHERCSHIFVNTISHQ